MNDLTKLYLDALKKGFEAAKMVTEYKDKALVYSDLAKAIGSTGLVEIPSDVKIEATDSKDSKKKGNKNSLKTEASKPAKEDKADEKEDNEIVEPVNESTEDVQDNQESDETNATEQTDEEVTEEWTEENTAAKAEVLERLNQFVEAWGEDYVYGDLVSAWSEGAFTGAENIRPTNIDGFVAYLDSLNEAEE